MMTAAPITFQIQKKLPNSLARAGVITTPHGDIETPAFIPVGTKATVKSLKPEDLFDVVGAQLALANTYHLYLQPGHDIVKATGGLHEFAGWHKPTITDSGGFQVFSLGSAFGKGVTKFAQDAASANAAAEKAGLNVYSAEVATEHGKLCIIDEEGVTFTSHHDGSMHRFTPERSVEIQHAIGADIIFAFDECTSPTDTKEYQREAMNRTHRWAKRSVLAHKQNYEALKKQGIFGVVQGGLEEDLRKESARVLGDMDFDGYGIGGCFTKKDMEHSLEWVNNILPEEKPRHLMGIGEPEDIKLGVMMGCDVFDCVAPTRLARNGTVYVETGERDELDLPVLMKIDLTKHKFIRDFSPLDPLSASPVAQQYTKAYLSHLFRANEMLGAHLASIHNLWTIVNYTKLLRNTILENEY